jgi:hypothetical protein
VVWRAVKVAPPRPFDDVEMRTIHATLCAQPEAVEEAPRVLPGRSVTVPPLPAYARSRGLSIPPLSLDPSVRLILRRHEGSGWGPGDDAAPESRSEVMEALESELSYVCDPLVDDEPIAA